MSKVSVIIPAFNAANTLDATIESVVAQTCSDWEIIIWDDGSSDATSAVAKRWCDCDARIRLITGLHSGVAAARNHAAKHALAEWLLFLDADDIITNDHLETTLAATSNNPTPDVIYAAGARMAPDGRIGPIEKPPQSEHFRYFASHNSFFTHACLISRSTFVECGGFDPELTIGEDWDLWQRLARARTVFFPIEKCLALYRMRPASLTHDGDLIFENAIPIIARGHGPDLRVRNPQPNYANGAPKDEKPYALIRLATWCIAMMIGAGKDADRLLQRTDFACLTGDSTDTLVKIVPTGLAFGACAPLQDWPALFFQFGTRIHEAFLVMEDASKITGFAKTCMDALRTQANLAASTGISRLRYAPPQIGHVDFGDLWRTVPISTQWGYDRGQPIDRLYIESFLQRYAGDVRGRVLEVGDDSYARRFGGGRVARCDVLHIREAPGVTIVADLATADHIPANSFDCIILTQTLQYVFDLSKAIATLHRILKPGGVLLLSVPGIGHVGHDEWENDRVWSFTAAAVSKLLQQQFQPEELYVQSQGNLIAATGFLHGLAQEDLLTLKHQTHDPHYPVTILARATKAEGTRAILVRTEENDAKAALFVRSLRNPQVSSVMVVAAHPDDEVIGAGGTMRFWPDVSVIHVTNGAPKNPDYIRDAGFADQSGYAAARRREAEEALALAKIPSNRLISMGIDDQNASFQLATISRQLADLFDRLKPDVIVTHPYEGGHPDHDAVCFGVQTACALLAKKGIAVPSRVEMSSYFGLDGKRIVSSFLSQRPPAIRVPLEESARVLKRKMAACHKSQSDLIDLFPVEYESFRPAPEYDFHQAPQFDQLFYDQYDLGIKSPKWRELAAAALDELRL